MHKELVEEAVEFVVTYYSEGEYFTVRFCDSLAEALEDISHTASGVKNLTYDLHERRNQIFKYFGRRGIR